MFGRFDDGLHWNPVEKDVTFQLLKCFEHWTGKRHTLEVTMSDE